MSGGGIDEPAPKLSPQQQGHRLLSGYFSETESGMSLLDGN
jgi:hypothetical protein